ncbi:hypothetical protein DPMN_117251 [Dreissena polymorpha]|uniref:Uncharacterized protein n=1 Tax=Dreissena polymorpha TaxID=45954 RepID=A0A9D4QU47_DREPO|nr:hypothetical protein DPMN_117251 [Dreissena polymorpha]
MHGPSGNVFQATGTICVLIQDVIGTNLLIKFHDDRTIHVASKEKCLVPWRHVFQPTGTIFNIVQDIIRTNLLTKFHEDRTINFNIDWTINVTLIVIKRKHALTISGHVYQQTRTIFELIQDTIKTNVLTKFHEYCTTNVISRVLISNVIQLNGTILKLIQYIIVTNNLTKCHEDRTINVALISYKEKCHTPDVNFSQPTETIFEIVKNIIGTNLLIMFHGDWTIHVASRMLKRKISRPLRKNFTPHGSMFFDKSEPFSRTINVASRVLKSQMLTLHDRQNAITIAHQQQIVLR